MLRKFVNAMLDGGGHDHNEDTKGLMSMFDANPLCAMQQKPILSYISRAPNSSQVMSHSPMPQSQP